MLFAQLLIAGYLSTAVCLHVWTRNDAGSRIVRVAISILAGFTLPLLALLVLELNFSRMALLLGLAAAVGLIGVPFLVPGLRLLALPLLAEAVSKRSGRAPDTIHRSVC